MSPIENPDHDPNETENSAETPPSTDEAEKLAKKTTELTDSVQEDPVVQDARNLVLDGLVFFSQNDLKNAESRFKVALIKARNHEEIDGMANNGLALCSVAQGKIEEAIQFANEALTSPNLENQARTHTLLGGIYLKQGKLEKSEKALISALEINPKNEEVLEMLKQFPQKSATKH